MEKMGSGARLSTMKKLVGLGEVSLYQTNKEKLIF